MISLFLLFLLGWPKERTIWVPYGTPCPKGMYQVKLPTCCSSMEPALHGGEIGFIEIYHGQPVYPGDIVATTARNLHRITAINSRAIITSGDANRWSDGWTSKNNIVYILRYVVRNP